LLLLTALGLGTLMKNCQLEQQFENLGCEKSSFCHSFW